MTSVAATAAIPCLDPVGTSLPLTVFLDGAHIRCRPDYQRRRLDVVVAKIKSPNMCRCFELVQQATLSPANQLCQDLCTLGWDGKRSVTVISDVETALPNLVFSAVRQPIRPILDW
jgi:transposase-like protein